MSEVKFRGTVTHESCGIDSCSWWVQVDQWLSGEPRGDWLRVEWLGPGCLGQVDLPVEVGDSVEVYGEGSPLYVISPWVDVCGDSTYYIRVVSTRLSPTPAAPYRFFGGVTFDGEPVPDGTRVEGIIDGNACGYTTTTSGGQYILDVYSAGDISGCGSNGATVKFRVGGVPAAQSATWQSGAFQELDLTAYSA